MTTRILLVLAFVMAAAATLVGGVSTARADVTCTGTIGGASTVTTISGNVIVPASASCTLSFVNVSGDVTVGSNANLLVNGYIEPSTIGGNVVATRCGSAMLQGNVTVGGGVLITACNGGPSGFQGPDTLIQGNFTCQYNAVLIQAAACEAWLGKVVGAVTITSNVSPIASDVSLVTISGTLDCESNSPAMTKVHGPSWVDGSSLGQCAGFATTTTSISNGTVAPAASCAALASLPASGFPVPNLTITSAVDTAATSSLPERCIVNGYINRHLSPVDNCYYQEGFQVQMPLPAAWNGRFWMQGGSGTEGSVPTATGTNSGSAGSNFGITNGYAVASQDGGHENTDLASASCDSGYGNQNEMNIDPMGNLTESTQSIEVTALVAKYVINQYYGNGPNRSYWVGCSTGGRQSMVMLQNYPSFFDGIVAGDPVYDLEAIQLSLFWSLQQIQTLYAETPGLPAEQTVAGPAPTAPEPLPYAAFPTSDQALFESALLQACDAYDGVMDGVVDNQPACQARFDPAHANWTDYAGALGPANTTYALQCTGAKTATCLSAAQIQAVKNIHQGPRTSSGQTVKAPAGAAAPDPVDNTAQGYAYDGGFFTTVSVPQRNIGSARGAPGLYGTGTLQFLYAFLSPPNPTFDPLNFNYNTGPALLNSTNPLAAASTSLNISHFVNYGHKIIWYHGASDPGPPFLGTLLYYQQMAEQFGGIDAAQNFSRLYPVPNMDHCTGGATTDQFDMATPLVNWVEKGTAPTSIPATGTNFNAATYQVVGNYITGSFINAPTTRSRLLCPYPQQARFTGKVSLVNGVPVASNPSDLSSTANYTCLNVVQTATHDFNGDGKSDILWRDASSNVEMWLMNGAQVSQASPLGNVGSLWSVVGQRDFNSNGDADILWRDTSGNVGMWLMNGGSIASSVVIGNVPTSWNVVGTGNFNGDGYGDILWRDSSGNLAVWFMNGATIAQSAVIGNLPTAWSVAGADSKGDIFLYNSTTGEVGMWVMNGTQIVQAMNFGPVSSAWKITGIGDFDGNGSTDILFRDTSGNVAMWLLNGTQVLSTAVIGNVPTTWTAVQTGDYNGDGKSDILWVDNLGNVAAWFMNGTAASSVVNYGNVGTTWSVQSVNAE